jgi:hypothetical protein
MLHHFLGPLRFTDGRRGAFADEFLAAALNR